MLLPLKSVSSTTTNVPAIRGQLMGRFKLEKKNKNISKKNGGSKLDFA